MKTATGNSSTNNKSLLQQLEFIDVFNQLGLSWGLVNEITRSRMVQGVLQKSLLDQVLYTNDALVSSVNYFPIWERVTMCQ